jgi:hypothetical protein
MRQIIAKSVQGKAKAGLQNRPTEITKTKQAYLLTHENSVHVHLRPKGLDKTIGPSFKKYNHRKPIHEIEYALRKGALKMNNSLQRKYSST